jgi:hypothetical protein
MKTMTLIEVLRDYNQASEDGMVVSVNRQALDEAIALLERQRWIPVSERLPEAESHHVSADVLAIWDAGDCRHGIAYYDHEDGRWLDPTGSFEEYDCEPTHWMPLPEAPR